MGQGRGKEVVGEVAIRGLGGVKMLVEECICIIYSPNLGLLITLFAQGKREGRFGGSIGGARGSNGGPGSRKAM